MQNQQDLFSAIFESYSDSPANSINLKEIRTRFGGVVKKQLTFEVSKVENMPTNLTEGEFAPFIANLEFKNVKFINVMQVRGDDV